MTQEQKQLLLKDLCARIPYGVKVNAPFTSNKRENAKGYKITGINFGVVEWTSTLFGEKKQRNSIVIEAFSEKYNQYCSIDLELNNNIEEVKPYLFPLSSMTEEQYNSLHESGILDNCSHSYEYVNSHIYGVSFIFKEFKTYSLELIEWLNKNHFDYRGLIPLGLAKDATNLNIY